MCMIGDDRDMRLMIENVTLNRSFRSGGHRNDLTDECALPSTYGREFQHRLVRHSPYGTKDRPPTSLASCTCTQAATATEKAISSYPDLGA